MEDKNNRIDLREGLPKYEIKSQFRLKEPFLIEEDIRGNREMEDADKIHSADIQVSEVSKKPRGWGQRHTLAILGFWGFAMSYAMRFNLTIAIVAMVRSPPDTHSSPQFQSEGNETEICGFETSPDSTFSQDDPEHGEFNWNSEEQGLILGSFFWGYVLTQLPGGFLAKRFGGKWPLGLGLLISGLFTLLTPLAARANIAMLMYVRIIAGLSQGLIFPAMQKILSKWSPPEERSWLSSIAYSGAQLGTAVTMISSGYLIDSVVGWPSIFYLIGGLTVIWFFCWTFFVYESPAEHPWISEPERQYIQTSIGDQISNEVVSTPWKEILSSKPIWAILISQIGHTWGFYTLLIELPTYFKTVLHFDLKENSLLSAMPPFLTWISTNVMTWIADYCIAKKYAKTITVRKVAQAVGDLSSALAMLGATLVSCNRTAAVAFLTIAVCMSGSVYAGTVPNQVEIACNHVAIIMGITNTVANVAGFATALVTGYLTSDHARQGNWGSVFYIAIALYVLDVAFYLVFASSEEEPWNRKRGPINPSRAPVPEKIVHHSN